VADLLRRSLLSSLAFLLLALPGLGLAAEDPAPFPDMAKVVGEILDKNYYDHKRFHPRVMVERALRALETAEMSIDTTWLADSIVLQIGDAPRQKVEAPEPKTLADAMNLIEQVRIRVDGADFPAQRRRDLDYALINGALLSLDPHTVLFPPEPAKEFGEEIQGEFFGIGAYLVQEEGVIAIERVMAGLPADRAGVEDGDVILRIDEERTAGLSLEQAVKRIKGPKGSTVRLTLERKGSDKPVELPIVRDLVQVISTRSYRSGDVGYVRMDDFSANTAHELFGAINDLQAKPLSAFVIDLRFNGGGLLDAAKTISQFFLSKKREIVRTVTSDGGTEKFFSSGMPNLEVPMVVLVSGGSASAAEILSGALQRNDRAVVAGTTTFGKGSVQAVKPLRDGSKLKLTIQEYQLPGGVSIQDVGITPDLRLVRHSQRKDGLLDLLPFTRDREVDDEFAIQNTHKYEHDSAYELGWLAAYQTKDQQKKSSLSARDFTPDPEATLVIDLLKEAAARPGFAERAAQARKDGRQRQFLIEELKEPVAKRAESEATALAGALAKRDPPVEWGPKAPTIAPGSVTMAYEGPEVVDAGSKALMRFAVRNAGGAELGRLYGVVNADKFSPLWEEELVVGRVPAKGESEAVMLFRVPPRLYDGEERFSVDLFADGVSAPVASLPVSIHIRAEPRGIEQARRPDGSFGPFETGLRPHFSYSWKIEEPSGDGQLSPGETATLHLTLRNDGDAPSVKSRLFVYKSDDPFVGLSEVRFFIDPLPVGGESTQTLKVTVFKELKHGDSSVPFSADAVKLQIRAEESFEDDKAVEEVSGVYRATLYSTLQLPVNQPISGGTVIQPQLALLSVETLPENRIKLHVRVSDDNPRSVCLFQDEDKIDLRPASALSPTGEGDSAVKALLYEPFVTLKPGLNNLRVVVSDKEDVTDVLPLRLWGPQPTSPVSQKAPAVDDSGPAVP
jgi:carboxyl-terminal processing protease